MRKHRCPGGVKDSTLSGDVRGLGFDSHDSTLFSIDLCCIYLVFTMLFIFVKRMYMYSYAFMLRPRPRALTHS